jgi:hypothetical protein
VTGPRALRLLGLLALFASSVLTACGAEEDPPVGPTPAPVATLQDLVAPWQATPFALDAAWRNTIVTTCWAEMGVPPSKDGIVDVRGAGVATVRLTGPTFGAKCDALRITPEGHVTGAGSGSGNEAGPPPVAPLHLGIREEATIGGGGLTVTGWSVTGRVSAEVGRVEVSTDLYPSITATVENGWFSAWWPTPPGEPPPREGAMPPYRIRAFDADGRPLMERRGGN